MPFTLKREVLGQMNIAICGSVIWAVHFRVRPTTNLKSSLSTRDGYGMNAVYKWLGETRSKRRKEILSDRLRKFYTGFTVDWSFGKIILSYIKKSFQRVTHVIDANPLICCSIVGGAVLHQSQPSGDSLPL